MSQRQHQNLSVQWEVSIKKCRSKGIKVFDKDLSDDQKLLLKKRSAKISRIKCDHTIRGASCLEHLSVKLVSHVLDSIQDDIDENLESGGLHNAQMLMFP
jgi:hypothetical protein